MFASIKRFEAHLVSERMNRMEGPMLVSEWHLAAFFQLGWLKETEGKPGVGRGDSKETLQFGIPQPGNKDRKGAELGVK